MKTKTQTILLWVVVGLSLIFLFDLWNMPTHVREDQVIFSDFMAKLDKGDFEKVIIQGHQISGVLKDNFQLRTYSADYPDLVNVLRAKNVQIEVKPPDEGPWYLRFLMTWGPFILFLGLFVFIMRRMQVGNQALSLAKSKARLARFEELSDYEYQRRNETQEIFIPVAERLGTQVIEFKNVTKSFGDRVLIDNLSFNIPAGAIVGIIGPNGAGKSTLFKLIAGKEQSDSGEVVVGQTVKMAYVDQSRDALSDDKTVWEDVSGGLDILNVGKFQMASRAYCGRFNFNGGDQQKKVGMLSGGERGRLHLAKTLMQGGNVLLLDEPSNDLDVETLRALEDALLEFAGSVMVISHDRWFLDRIATHILAAEGDSQWVFFDGNYQEYEADKKRRLGEEGAKPKRVRYKALK